MPMPRVTHTYAELEISNEAYQEIHAAIDRAEQLAERLDGNAIDMHGIAVVPEPREQFEARHKEAADYAARELYAITRQTNGPRVLAEYASENVMKAQLEVAEIVIEAYRRKMGEQRDV